MLGDDPARRFEAVHDRHLAIHQDQVEAGCTTGLDRLGTVSAKMHAASESLQLFERQNLIDRVVFDHQDA